jgi:hypothetical protein
MSTRTLDAKEPVGTYKLDAHAGVLFPDVPEDIAVNAIRAEVSRAAQLAAVRARHESVDLRKARGQAKRLIKLLKNVERDSAKWFPTCDVAAAAADLSVGFAGKDDASVIQPLVQIIESLNSLRDWSAELNKRASLTSPPPSRSDPLARYFVEAMAVAHLARRKKQPPSGRTGPFVDLLEAAWLDLGFPKPTDEEGFDHTLKVWLGTKVEERARALRGLTTKNSGRSR